MSDEHTDSIKIPLRLIAHEMEQEPEEWALNHMWVEVEVRGNGDIEPVKIDEETLAEAEEEYVNLLVEKGNLTQEFVSRVLDGE